MPHPSNVSNFLCIPFLYQKYITSNCTWLVPCRSFNLLISFQLWYTCPTSYAVPQFVHRQKKGERGGSAGMDWGRLGERIRLAQNKYFCLLVWFVSSDLMRWLFAAKFQVSLCIGPKSRPDLVFERLNAGTSIFSFFYHLQKAKMTSSPKWIYIYLS